MTARVRRDALSGLLALLAACPLVYIGLRIAEASNNIAYWDEFDTVLSLILRLQSGTTPTAFLTEIFSVNNEHRMVTSRLLFAACYWLTGTVNFNTIGLIGNATLVALGGLLVATARTLHRRLRLGLVFVFVVFQLESYENFLWSGSSIDHFQVLLLVALAVAGLSLNRRVASLGAGLAGLLATFTLAHGLLIWPLGALMLARARRWRTLLGWTALSLAAVAGYLTGFSLNHEHRFAGFSAEGLSAIVRYWMTLLGSVPALGNQVAAPWLGAVLLGTLCWLGTRRRVRGEPIVLPLAWFAVAALGLIAVGRAEIAGGAVQSRYVVIAALAWSLVIFMLMERYSHPRRPLTLLLWCLPYLVVFNVTANRKFAPDADSWVECRNIAVSRFKQFGADGHGPFSLFPTPARSTQLLREAESRGIYRLGALCLPRPLPDAKPAAHIAYSVDELTVNDRAAFVRGWAAIPGVTSDQGQIQVILRSDRASYVFTTVSVQRPDVAQAHRNPTWNRSGFIFSRRRDRLPAGDYELGFLVNNGSTFECVMTRHRLVLEQEGRVLLAAR